MDLIYNSNIREIDIRISHTAKMDYFVCLFGLRLYVPVNNFSVMSGRTKWTRYANQISEKSMSEPPTLPNWT